MIFELFNQLHYSFVLFTVSIDVCICLYRFVCVFYAPLLTKHCCQILIEVEKFLSKQFLSKQTLYNFRQIKQI